MKKILIAVMALALNGFAQIPIDTPPSILDYGSANQGSCVMNQTASGKLTISHPGAAGLGFNWCVFVDVNHPIPAPPYSLIFGIEGFVMDKSSSLGFTIFDATTSKFIVYSFPGSSDTGVNSIAAWKFNNFTTYVGPPYFTLTNSLFLGGLRPKYGRVRDNGSFRTFAVSQDKETWLTVHIVPTNDFILPTYFGFTLRGTGNGVASIMTINHVQVTTP